MNRIRYKKWWILSVMFMIFAVGIYVLFATGYSTYFTNTPNTLHVWRPSILPNGLSVSKEEYQRRVLPALGMVNYEYIFTLNNGFTIYERTHSTGLSGIASCATWDGETDCQEYTTKDGLVYHVVTAKHDGIPFDLTIEASDTTTDFHFSIPEPEVKNYLSYDWSLMMNSLKPVDISHKHPQTVTEHCCGG